MVSLSIPICKSQHYCWIRLLKVIGRKGRKAYGEVQRRMAVLASLPLDCAPEGAVFSAAENPRRLSPFGDWRLVTFLHGVCEEWRVTSEDSGKVLEHPTVATSCLRTGDGSWRDFVIEFEVRQMLAHADTSMDEMFNTRARTGVMFRYVSYRHTYALFLESLEEVVLCRREEANWVPLAGHRLEIDPGRYYHFRVECRGDRITCDMDGKPLFDITDGTYERGRIAIYANTLSRFGPLEVTADAEAQREMEAFRESERRAEARSAGGVPEPQLRLRIPHPDRKGAPALNIPPGGDLESIVILTEDARFAAPGGAALVAVGADGRIGWSSPVSREAHPFIWDLDGDGHQEVICYDGPVLRLLDARTGKAKLEKPTPCCNSAGNRGGRENKTPYIPLYDIFPANLRGLGKGRDLVIFDYYTAAWVLNDRLEVEWWCSCEHGHDIGLYDIDGDGRDELLCGYVMFDHDGTRLWEMAGTEYMVHSHHHVDHILIGEYDGDPGTGLEIALVSGNAGFFLLDQEGCIRAHHCVGHAQSLVPGRLRPDLPGEQFLVGCRWGNPGTRVLFSGDGRRLWTAEWDNSYAADLPVQWTPERDLIVVVTTPEAAGFYDGFARMVMPFPQGRLSAADRIYRAADLTGSGLHDFVMVARDEVMVFSGSAAS